MLLSLLLAAGLVANSPAVAGHWEGFMQRGSARLAVSVDFPPEQPGTGRFTALDLGAIDVPVSHLTLGDTVHWELIGDTTTTTFDGTVGGDSLSGAFREGDRAGTFTLARTSASTQKAYSEKDVTFVNGGVRLAGTVFAPRSPGKHAALLFVHGSGPEGRWGAKPIADYVARHGIVALVYDKRGVGGSSGDWHTATLQDLAADARAGIHLLAAQADVDPEKVGVYGHSQGAEIAPAIAQGNPEVHWIVAADGPVGPQYRQDLYRVDTALAERYSGQQLRDAERLYAEFVNVARSGAPHGQLRTNIATAGATPWLDDLAIPGDDSWIWPWYRLVGNYDNTTAWSAVRVPVLLLFGSGDRLVPPGESVATTLRILKAHDPSRVVVRVFPGADHMLRVPPAIPDGWPHNAAGFPAVIVEFAADAL